MNGLGSDPLAERLGRLPPEGLARLVRGLQERIDGLRARLEGPIAVVGMALRVPGASSPDALWDLLCRGDVAIGPVPEDRWSASALARQGVPPFGGFIDGIDTFDATFFRIPPAEAAAMDPQQRLAAEVAWEALESAGYALAERRPASTGVFLGLSTDDYKARFLGEPAGVDPRMATGTANSVAAGRLSYLFDLTGPALVVDTACSSSLVAAHLACRSLRSGECDMALAGGVGLLIEPELTVAFAKLGMLSALGRCATFQQAADGYVRGEGSVMLVLKRLADAERDGDAVLAVIRGSAVNQDGRSNGLTAPNGTAQRAVIAAALADAGLAASEVDGVECHGTATPLGDPIEVEALAAVYGSGRDPQAPLLLGSVKANIGHLEAAAGVAGLAKAVLCLMHGAMPGQPAVGALNPRVDWARLPLRVADTSLPLAPPDGRRARLGVSSFGFSGTNAHILLEAPPPAPVRPVRSRTEETLIALSAPSPQTLAGFAERAAAALLRQPEGAALADLPRNLIVDRRLYPVRCAAVGADAASLGEAIVAAAARTSETKPEPPRIAFLFTGQGSQWMGMGRALAEQEPVFRSALEECVQILRSSGLDLPTMLWSEAGRLDQTGHAQPAIFALQYALGRLWRHWGVQPDFMVGHSIGEYAAACLAGVMDLDDALTLVATRGRLMQSLPTGGGMLAVEASEAQTRAWLADHPELDLAAVNAATSTVVAGPLAALDAFAAALPDRSVRPLRVSHAFHSRAMEPILADFAAAVARVRLRSVQRPLIATAPDQSRDLDWSDPAYWVRQLREPVRFADAAAALEADVAVEIGPRPVLLGLLDHPGLLRLASLREREETNGTILRSLGALFSAGAEIDWRAFHQDRDARPGLAPTTPFRRERHWTERPTVTRVASPRPEAPDQAETPAPDAMTATEDQVRAILAEAMQLPLGAISPATPFVELGADSLILTQVAARIERRFGVKISRRDLFTSLNTVVALHRHVTAAVPIIKPAPASAPAQQMEPAARAHIDRLARRLRDRLPGSWRARDEGTANLADSRGSAGYRPAVQSMLFPLVGDRADGARIWDVDGNEHLDITMGFGVQLFGHAAPFVTDALRAQLGRGLQLGPQARSAGEAARRIHRLTGVDRIAFCNTGTEAVMTALRLARLATGRSMVALFEGSYHGHFDGVLANAGAEDSNAQPLSAGTPQGFVRDVLVLDYGNPDRAMALLDQHRSELAAVLVEPVQSRRPGLQPRAFLRQLRAWTERAGVALIFDEVLLGFRIALGGAQAWAEVEADLVTYGKIIGGGLPIGVVAGRRSFMDRLDGGAWALGDTGPSGPTIFFAGTFNKNPLTIAASVAVLEELEREGPALQEGLNRRTEALAQRLNAALAARTGAMRVDAASSLFRFVGAPDVFYYNLLDQGLYVWEGRTCFLSTRHTDADLDRIVAAVTASADALVADGLLPGLPGAAPAVAAAAPTEESLPLTAGQRGLWLTCQMSDAVSAAYNQSLRLDFDTSLDLGALGRALAALVRRHPNLRARFQPDGHSLRVLPDVSVPVERLAGEAEAAERRFCWRPFDLEQAPLLRLGVSETGGRFRLTLVLPHLVTDGWSLSVMVTELAALYRAECRNDIAELPEPGSPRRYLQAILAEDSLAGDWVARFTPPPAALSLPTTRPRPPVQSFNGGRVTRQLGAERLQRLRRLCSAEGVGLFAAGLAAFAMLLGRLGRTNDLAIGVLSAGQSAHGMPNLVGYYANLLPIRLSLDPNAAIASLLAQCQQALDAAMDGRDYPFAELVRRLGLPRDPSRPLLVSVGFNLDRLDAPPDFGVPVRLEANGHGAVRWDLFFNLVAEPDGIVLQADYATALFDAAQIETWVEDYIALLDRFVAEPQARQAPPVLLPPVLLDRILDNALRQPRGAAVDDGRVILTYGDLLHEADRAAGLMHAAGVRPGEVVAADLGRSVAMVVAMVAAWRIGAVFMPLDPTHPPEYRRMLMRDAAARCCLCDPDAPVDQADAPFRLALRLGDPSETAGFAPVLPTPEASAYLLYTSGSTGQPKGVLVSHGALSAYTAAILDRTDMASDPPFRFAVVSSLAADLGYTCVFGALWTGGTLRIFQQIEMRDPAAFAAAMTVPPVDVLKIVPTHLAALLDWPEPAAMLPRTHLVLGGEASHWPLIERLWRLAPCRVFNHYGPTETTIGAAAVELTSALRERSPETVPLGFPLRHARITIDKADGEETGEILIAGDGVAIGYLNRPEQEAARFAPDPLGPPGGRLYRTGDRGRRTPDGLLLFLGRLDDEVKIRGHRVAPATVAASLRDCVGVRDCAVLTEENVRGEPRLTASVVAADGLDEAALRRWMTAHLPLAMVPDTLRFVAALPLTANGKVDREELRSSAAEQPLASDAMLRIWREVLAMPDAGPDDNFFSLGGDSIMAIQVAGRARAAGLRCNAQLLFEHPTVHGLLAAMGETTVQPSAVVPPVSGAGPVPLSPVQCAFFALGLPQPNHWCMSALLRLSGQPDPGTVWRALRAAESRHAALRLRFEPDGAAHAVDECVINKPVLFNQRGLDAADRRAQEDRVAAECIGGIDITRGPLLAAALLDRGAHEPSVLLVAVHHLVFDAISWSILADDLTAALAGTALPAPGAGFDLWCHALRRHAEGLDAQRPLWRRIEAGIAPILPRLTSGRGANLERHVAREIIRLSPAETAACKQAAGSVGTAGLPEAVLTALAVSLRPWVSGPVVLDVEGHGREAIDPALEVERTIGWFTTHYPVMLDVDARDAPRAQLDQVRQAWRSLPESGLGYGILRHLRSAEGVGRDPDVSFNFLGNLETGTASPFERFGTAHERDPAAPRRYLLVVEAFTAGGALTIELLYPRGLVADEVIASIADGMADWFDRFAEPGALQSLPEELALSADDLQALNERLGL